MPVTVVVGGQSGSEGKGKVCAHLALSDEADVMIRCGGPNAGHTVDLGDRKFELKQVPAGFVNSRTRLLMAPGALVDPQLLLHEIEECGLDSSRFGIDRNAGIVERSDRGVESSNGLRERLGSTGMGVGSAVSRRVLRESSFRLASEVPELAPFITSVRDEANDACRDGRRVVVEGTPRLRVVPLPHVSMAVWYRVEILLRTAFWVRWDSSTGFRCRARAPFFPNPGWRQLSTAAR